MNDFSALAQYYDRFVGADYNKIADYIDSVIKQYAPSSSLVCDIGCGSGTLTLKLLQQGYDMIGIDGSIDMLSEALDKRADIPNGDKALFLCQQLPEFELYGTVDVIVSTLDTLNYIIEDEDLDRLFYWIRNYLNPGGLLIFDINTLYKYTQLLDQHCEFFEDEEVFLAWRSQFDGKLCEHHLAFFNRDEDVYLRSDEEQLQRYYSIDQIYDLLKKYRFTVLKVEDDYSCNSLTDHTQRITITAKKEDIS